MLVHTEVRWVQTWEDARVRVSHSDVLIVCPAGQVGGPTKPLADSDLGQNRGGSPLDLSQGHGRLPEVLAQMEWKSPERTGALFYS